MWTSHSPPSVAPTITVVGTGASIVTPPADLFNRRPQDATAVQWLSAAVPAITDVVRFQFVWPNALAFVPGLVGLFGLNLLGLASSAGLKFSFAGQRLTDGATFPYALGGNTALQRSVTRSDGSTCAIGVCATGLTAIRGFEMAIWNDQLVAGVPTATLLTSQFIHLGDVWGGPAFDQDIDGDWTLSPPSYTSPDSVDNQPWPNPHPEGRTLTCNRQQLTFGDAYIDGANPCIQTLATVAGQGRVSIMIPRWKDASNVLSPANVHATAVFGVANWGEIQRGKGELYKTSWSSKEIPALVA